jgi:hypothetical protein
MGILDEARKRLSELTDKSSLPDAEIRVLVKTLPRRRP